MAKELAFPTKYRWKTNTVPLSLGASLVLSLGLLPVYTFASGGFQIVDIPLALLILMSLLIHSIQDVYTNQIKKIYPFLAWAILINLFYFVLYADTGYLKAIIIVTYTPMLLYFFMKVYYNILEENKIYYIYIGLFLSIIFAFITKGPPDEEDRAVLSFNDPNQLGYFAAIMLAYAILLMKFKEIANIRKPIYFIFDGILIFISHLFILYALSRSAMAAFFILDLCLIRGLRNIKIISAVGVCILLLLVYITLLNPDFITQRFEVRDPTQYSKEEIRQGFESRTIDPIKRMSGIEYLIGRGQGGIFSYRISGAEARGTYGGESHNIFGEIFRGYGAIGIILFLMWLIHAIWISRVFTEGLWVWAGLLTYNIGNYGFRFRAFWIVLALLMVMCRMVADKKAQYSVSQLSPLRIHK